MEGLDSGGCFVFISWIVIAFDCKVFPVKSPYHKMSLGDTVGGAIGGGMCHD